jgi:hypothetical protein
VCVERGEGESLGIRKQTNSSSNNNNGNPKKKTQGRKEVSGGIALSGAHKGCSEGPRGVKFQSQDADQYAFTDTPALSQADEGSAGALPSRRRQQLARELRRGKRWDERPEYLARRGGRETGESRPIWGAARDVCLGFAGTVLYIQYWPAQLAAATVTEWSDEQVVRAGKTRSNDSRRKKTPFSSRSCPSSSSFGCSFRNASIQARLCAQRG